ncbi:glycosyltransferase family 4 protein [uncultured Sphingomonas sp.]|uniref:glycosyltransferase family 4 protein n=1 Tax=uncultured Sphingomonas sp. TaxID=158754 RepID=UPI0035CA4878
MVTRLLMTTDAVGGVWHYSLELAASLRRSGVDTMLAVLGPAPTAAQRDEALATTGITLIETGLPLDWLSDGPAPIRAAGQAIADLARAEGVDLVQLNMPTLAAGVRFAVPVVAVTHGCVGTWWQAARSLPLAPQYHWHKRAMADGLAAAARVVAPSAAYAATVARHYALPAIPRVVHNGRTPGPRDALGPLADDVMTVGRLWDPVKNAALLDRVAAGLAVPFRAAGAIRGPHGETATLEHLDLLGEIPSPDLARQLAARPVFVSAATFEPFGLAVLEAAAAGCALVLSDIATFRELWDGVATFVPANDEAGYTEAIETLIGDTALRTRLGEAARRRAARYTPERTADAMLRVYASALPTGAVRAAA